MDSISINITENNTPVTVNVTEQISVVSITISELGAKGDKGDSVTDIDGGIIF